MSRRRKYAPIERIRRILLVLLLILASGVVVVYMRRDRPEPTPRPRTDELLDAVSGDDVVLAGEGFEYAHTEGERTVFRLQASKIASSREGVFRLRDVRVDVEREEGKTYVVRSDEATYEIRGSDALLRGNVRVSSGRGLELRTDGLDLVRGGAGLQSQGEVRFALGEAFSGRADRLVYNLERERLRLEGKVRVFSRRGAAPEASGSLRADEVVIERLQRLVRAHGDVELRRGASFLRARRLGLSFAEDEQTLEFVRASWDVEGSLRGDTGGDFGTTARFAADQLSVALAGGEPQRAELESEKGAPVRLTTRDDAGLERRMVAPYLMGEFDGGRIAVLRAYDGVTIDEGLSFAPRHPLRSVCAQWVLASFEEEGGIEMMVLQNEVDYRQQGLQAEGRRVEVRPGGLDLTGVPAVLRADQGQVEAPRIAFSGESSEVQAKEGVEAVFPPGGRFSLIGEGGEEVPIRLLARSARWTETPAQFSFSGQVRAWQGENYLLADRLVGDRGGDRLEASGQVKTVVRPRAEPAAGTAQDESAAAPRRPVEVTADSFTYARAERRLTYSGSVRAHETGRTLRCADLDAWMADGDRFERLECSGQVVLENPDAGHTLRGDLASYEPGRGRVEVSGTPVVMTDREGAELRGPVVIYDLDSGAAQVRSLPRAEAKN